MGSKAVTWKLKVDEDVYVQYQLAARFAKIPPDKFADRVLQHFLEMNRDMILDKSPERLKKFVSGQKDNEIK